MRIERAGVERVDEAGPLFRQMVDHHRGVVAGTWPVRQSEDAWTHRRREYVEWLSADGAWMLLALDEPTQSALGYAVIRLHESGASWNIGERIAELESLAVAEDARGKGVGAALLTAARNVCSEAGVTHWLVAVVDANAGALRFYKREGFRPYYQQLLSEIRPTGSATPPPPPPVRRQQPPPPQE